MSQQENEFKKSIYCDKLFKVGTGCSLEYIELVDIEVCEACYRISKEIKAERMEALSQIKFPKKETADE